MEAYLLDWMGLLLRWLHVITAIAWVGSSFYFVFLDSNLTPPVDDDLQRQGATGELWAVHGGGFYHPVKFAVAPPQMPARIHWFYWESYSTWMSGFALLCVTYLLNAQVYLIDPSRTPWSAGMSVVVALALLLGFWVVYDLICRVEEKAQRALQQRSTLHAPSTHHAGMQTFTTTASGVAIAAAVLVLTWLACHWFAGRAAFVLVGAAMATAMTANVLVWIIPGQRRVVAALQAGQPVDPVHGQRGKQRSVHNTYFTLPVLVAMLSNHYGFTHSHPMNWLVLAGLMLAGVLIRRFFVLRHRYRHRSANHPCRHPWPWVAAAVLVLVGMVVWMRPALPTAPLATPVADVQQGLAAHSDPQETPLQRLQNDAKIIANNPINTSDNRQKTFENVLQIVNQRCAQCHGAQLQMKGVRLDTPDQVRQHAAAIYQQVVVQRTMPMNNATQITEAERATLAQWFEAGR